MDLLRKPVGNQVLVPYGIEQEQSDMRAHVSVIGQCVYVYPTEEAIKTIQEGTFRKGQAKQIVDGREVVTGEGWLIPPKMIARCRCVDIPALWLDQIKLKKHENETARGYKAVRIVTLLLRNGWFPIFVDPKVVEGLDMQISGTDILVRGNIRIQVKCDFNAGDRKGCTGNLFIQTAECNPHQKH